MYFLVIFKSADARGWGLKCLQSIERGQPVIEYVGEIISLAEFRRREADHIQKSKMYCLELTPDDDNDDAYGIDGGYKGNHCRFINHSVSTFYSRFYV